jgi:hypothetical protein
MPRVRHADTPDYAVDVIDDARPIGSQLAVAAALLTVLLVAMTSVEAPMARHDPYSDGQGKLERPSPPALLCSYGGNLRDRIVVEGS